MKFLFRFTVKGNLPFPIDMLRHDRCTPDTESDSYAIARTFDPMSGTIEVCIQRTDTNGGWRPTERRWLSLGWTVTGLRTDRGGR